MATALYRRYRPESFAEVIGQDHVTTPLRRALRAGRIGHAYLFSGPRGCGKTTSARILARCLNCAAGPTDTPCGQCDSCRDLATGGSGSLDVVEIDAASHGGVDDARELRERASFAPVRDRYKVFIIDEAHMVTSAGFNALLKLVEEPPDHVKFVFATTEPDKVIGTIRSRTHHYPFRLIPPQVLGPYLTEVCAAEGVNVGEGVMPLVVRAGGGSARDSMSVLDQLMAGAGEDGLDFPTAISLLGFTDTALLDTAITAVAERDAGALYGAVEHVLATGHEPRRFVEDLLERMRDLIVLAAVPDRGADLLPQVPADDLERMRGQATMFAPADLSQCGDLVHETLSTMSGATSPRLHLELLAARLVLRDERAALAAAEASAPAGGRPAPAQGSRGAQAPQGSNAPASGGGGREEARRIAQERAESARQARGGRGQGSAAPVGQPGQGQAGHAQAGHVQPGQGQPDQGQAAPAPQRSPERHAPQGQQAARSWQASPEQRAPQEQQAPRSAAPVQQSAAPVPQSAAPVSQNAESGPQSAAPAPQESAPRAQGAGPGPGGGLNADEVRAHWSAILDELSQIRRPSWALVAQNGHVNAARGSTLVIGFRTEGLVSAFHRGTAAENLADAVRRIMHTDITVEAVVGEDPGPGGSGGSRPGSSGGGPAGPGGPGGSGGPGGDGLRPAPYASQGGPEQQSPAGPRGGHSQQHQSGSPQRPGPAQNASSEAGRGAAAPWGDAVAQMAPAAPAAAPNAPTAVPASAPSGGSAAPRLTSSSSAADAPRGQEGPRGQEAPQASLGQRAADRAMQAAARASQNQNRSSSPGPAAYPEGFPPEPDDEYPPEPDDHYPPDDGYSRSAPSRTPDARTSAAPAQSAGRWSDVLAPGSGTTAATPHRHSPSAQEDAPVAAPAAADAGEVPEVEDAGRDSLPSEEPRTYGQNALKRAIAEGRVIRSRPASVSATSTAPTSNDQAEPLAAPVSPAAESAADPQAAAYSAPSPQGSQPSQSPQAPQAVQPSQHVEPVQSAPASWSAPSASAPVSAASAAPAPAGPAPSASSGAPVGSAAERAAASWGSGPGPAAQAPAGAASAASAAPAPARSGAALVREAAQASRSAGLRSRGARPGVAEEPVDVDPTGGATRDDDDAVVANRNGREVIETVLGGKVLEVIDETDRR